jgi:uncharacterized protein (TIGR02391 family)
MTLSKDQRIVLQAIYGEFKPTGRWPIFQHLDLVLDQEHGLAVEPILMSLRPELVRVYTPIRPQNDVALRIAGLAHCDGSEDDLMLFGRTLQWTVEKERTFRPSSPHEPQQQIVTSEQATEEWREAGHEVSDLSLKKAYELLAVELLFESHGSNDASWQLTLSPRIRRFRGVRNYADYLRVIADDEPPHAAANPLLSPAADPVLVVQPPQRVTVVGEGSRAPEGPSLSLDSLHPLVRDAAQPLFAIEHYAQGVEKAVRVLRDVVREKSGFAKDDGHTLMGKALGGTSPQLVVADLSTETGKNIQRGTLHLAQGIIARMRNPLTHESGDLEPVEALEMVAVISRVVRDLDDAEVMTDTGGAGSA